METIEIQKPSIEEILKPTVKKSDIWKVPFAQLVVVPGLNIRGDMGDIPALAQSIKENGVKVPFRGWREGDKYFIVDGHRRYAACELLVNEGCEILVPFIIESKGSNAETHIVDMFITNDGKPLTPLEQAEGVLRLVNFGWELTDISKSIGKTYSYIVKLHSLSTAPKKLVKLIQAGKVSATLAMDLIGENGADAFLADYEAGKYDTPVEGKEKKITKAAVKGRNSWQLLKNYFKNTGENLITENKKPAYDFLAKVIANKVGEKSIINFFEK